MILRDTKVGTEVELIIDHELEPSMDNLPDGIDVIVVPSGDNGPNGNPMYQVIGTLPNVTSWLRTVYGMADEDILHEIPNFQLRDLIP